jgi:hypothetical protein
MILGSVHLDNSGQETRFFSGKPGFSSRVPTPTLGNDPAYFWESGGEMIPHYPTATLGTLTRYEVDLCESGQPDPNGKCPEVHDDDVVRCIVPYLSTWSPRGVVWSPQDMKLRVEKLAEVIAGVQWSGWLLSRWKPALSDL